MDSAEKASVYAIETDLLMRLTEPFKDILNSTGTDIYTINKKNEVWTKISKQYNINRRFKKKTCRELRKVYQRMVIKNRSRSSEMLFEDDKKPHLKKPKMSFENNDGNEGTSQESSNEVLKKVTSSASSSGVKQVECFPQKSYSVKKRKRQKMVLPKNCMVIMRPISDDQLKAITKSPVKLITSVSQKSPHKSKEKSAPSSLSSFLKLSPTCSTGSNVGVVIKVENGNIVTSGASQLSVSKGVSQEKSGLTSPPSPRQASSPSPNATSPSKERHASPIYTSLAGSNFSNTLGSATLTTSMAQTTTASCISVSSSERVPQPHSPETVSKLNLINTYSKFHPQMICQAGSPPPRTQFVKRIMLPVSSQPLLSSGSKISVAEPTSLVFTSGKVDSSKLGSSPIVSSKVTSFKPANLGLVPNSSSPTFTFSMPANVTPTIASSRVANCKTANMDLTSTMPKATSCTTAKVVPTISAPKVVSCRPAVVLPISTATKVPSCKADSVTTSSTSTTRSYTAGNANNSNVTKYTRCQLVPTSQAVAFLSRTTARSRLVESVAALPQSTAVVSSVESPPAAVTTTSTALAVSSVGVTSPTLPASLSFDEGQDERISMGMAEPEILNIRVLEANLDVRAARARADAEEALREEALAKLAMARAEMDHQALRHKIELRHMRRLNALALKHAKELHIAALSLRRKE